MQHIKEINLEWAGPTQYRTMRMPRIAQCFHFTQEPVSGVGLLFIGETLDRSDSRVNDYELS